MAKTSVVMRQKKREQIVAKYSSERVRLKAIIQDFKTEPEVRWQTQQRLQSLPRDSSPTRLRNRCRITGRARGVYRMFGLSRSILRAYIMSGLAPGVVKSSW